MKALGSISRRFLAATVCLALNTPALALETDQFYAWGKPIEDSTNYLNAWVRVQVQDILDEKVNGKPHSCEAAVEKIQTRLQHSIFQPIEVWINSSRLVDRIPRGVDEYRDYRDSYLLSKTYPLDTARGLQPSPTIEVNGIRIGSDKLAHFFSEGWWYYNWWKKHRDGLSENESEQALLHYGVKIEWWVQGKLLTGVISPADMEANYQGFIFYRQLCHGDQPLLHQKNGRWQFSTEFDIGGFVSPEWDESWNPNIYSGLRWKNISKTMAGYCPMLKDPWVTRQRARYAGLDSQTPVDALLVELVASGDLPDPASFDITAVCGALQ